MSLEHGNERKYSHFRPLEQASFLNLEHGASLKGFLLPFKGKGQLEKCASRYEGLRDDLIQLAQHDVLSQVRVYPFALLPIQLALQTTSAGTAFLRWRKADRSAMGVALWVNLISDPSTPQHLIADLYAMERQRITLNMQISLVHTIARQARQCTQKLAQAEHYFQQRIAQHNHKF